MRQATVVAVYPEQRSADIVFADTGMPVGRVQFAGWVSSDGGDWHVPSVPKPDSVADQASPSKTGRKLIALVDCVAGRPIIIGFTTPDGAQVAFTEQDRRVSRHHSGAYWTWAPDGSYELFHPSGSYLRIGTGPHQPLKPLSADNVWQEITSAPQPTVTLQTGKFSLVIDPDGNVSMSAQGTLGITAQKAATMTFPAGLTIDANIATTGTLTNNGHAVGSTHEHTASGGTGIGGPPV